MRQGVGSLLPSNAEPAQGSYKFWARLLGPCEKSQVKLKYATLNRLWLAILEHPQFGGQLRPLLAQCLQIGAAKIFGRHRDAKLDVRIER